MYLILISQIYEKNWLHRLGWNFYLLSTFWCWKLFGRKLYLVENCNLVENFNLIENFNLVENFIWSKILFGRKFDFGQNLHFWSEISFLKEICSRILFLVVNFIFEKNGQIMYWILPYSAFV